MRKWEVRDQVRRRRGFSLIELMVVISIISILSSLAVASLNSARLKARDAQRQSDLRQLYTALNLYYDANGAYPPMDPQASPPWWQGTIVGPGKYLLDMPKDPRNVPPYIYTTVDNSGRLNQFCLYTQVETQTNTWLIVSEQGLHARGFQPDHANIDTCNL